MNVVNICVYADGYYSNATYEENRTIKEESYNKVKDKIEELSIHISELDGKHSSVEAEFDIQMFDEDFQFNLTNDCKIDGDELYFPLKDIFSSVGLDLDAELKEVSDYIDGLDSYNMYEFRIRKSNYDKVKAFVDSLE